MLHLSSGEKTFLVFVFLSLVLTLAYGFISGSLPAFVLKGHAPGFR